MPLDFPTSPTNGQSQTFGSQRWTFNGVGWVLGVPGVYANISGGAAGSLAYQSAVSATALLPIGSAGQLLSVVSGLPAWTSTLTSALTINMAGTQLTIGSTTTGNGTLTNLPTASSAGGLTIQGAAGPSSNTAGASLTLQGGNATGTGQGGNLTLLGGAGTTGGTALITGGASSVTSNAGGAIVIAGGVNTVASNSAGGGAIVFQTAPIGATVPVEVARFTPAGALSLVSAPIMAANPAFSCYLTSASGALTSGTTNNVSQAVTKEFDVGNSIAASTGLFTCTVSGIYVFTWSACMAATTVTRVVPYLVINGVLKYGTDTPASGGPNMRGEVVAIAQMTAGQTVSLGVYTTFTGTGTLIAGVSTDNYFQGALIARTS